MANLWKYIMTDPDPGTLVGDYFETVAKTHYPLFSHNGCIYGISPERDKFFQLALTVKDIDQMMKE